jgi:hypothetical protein
VGCRESGVFRTLRIAIQPDVKIAAEPARKSLSEWSTIRKPASIGFPTPCQSPYLSNPSISCVLAEVLARAGHTYQASAPGQPPVSRSGRLDSHIVVRPFKNGEGVAIRETTFYALFLARGAHGGGRNTQDHRNILLAGETDARGRVLRGRNRLKASAISCTRVLLPRPSLELALGQGEALIEGRVKDAIMQGLKFKLWSPK